MGYDISLSASKLNLLKECRRCFYDANTLKIERPRGIVASITNGIDGRVKDYLDTFRGQMPPFLAHQGVPGRFLADIEKMKAYRHWKSGLQVELEVQGLRVRVIGALDDLLEACPGHSPFDAKTKGAAPKDDGAQYYQVQSDIYGLLLEKNGRPISGNSYFAYFWPTEMTGLDIRFDAKVYALRCSPAHAVSTIGEAVTLLKGAQPDFNPTCEMCAWAQVRVHAAVHTIARPAIEAALAAE